MSFGPFRRLNLLCNPGYTHIQLFDVTCFPAFVGESNCVYIALEFSLSTVLIATVHVSLCMSLNFHWVQYWLQLCMFPCVCPWIFIKYSIDCNCACFLCHKELEEFWAYQDLMGNFVRRLAFCVTAELIPLMEIPGVKLVRSHCHGLVEVVDIVRDCLKLWTIVF